MAGNPESIKKGAIHALLHVRNAQETDVDTIVAATSQLHALGEYTPGKPRSKPPTRRQLGAAREVVEQDKGQTALGVTELITFIDHTVSASGEVPLRPSVEELHTYQAIIAEHKGKQQKAKKALPSYPTEMPADFFKKEHQLVGFRQTEQLLNETAQEFLGELHVPYSIEETFFTDFRNKEVRFTITFPDLLSSPDEEKPYVDLRYTARGKTKLTDTESLRVELWSAVPVLVPLKRSELFGEISVEEAIDYLGQHDERMVLREKRLYQFNLDKQGIIDLLTLILVGKGIPMGDKNELLNPPTDPDYAI